MSRKWAASPEMKTTGINHPRGREELQMKTHGMALVSDWSTEWTSQTHTQPLLCLSVRVCVHEVSAKVVFLLCWLTKRNSQLGEDILKVSAGVAHERRRDSVLIEPLQFKVSFLQKDKQKYHKYHNVLLTLSDSVWAVRSRKSVITRIQTLLPNCT